MENIASILRKTFKAITFVTLTFFVSYFLVFSLQDKNAHINELYSMRNCDVLVLGSSHCYVNLSGAVMYNNTGIASACIGQGEQQVRYSYYSLKSALKICHPQYVILEVYMAARDDEYGDLPNQYANALLSFPIWYNFTDRLEVSSDLKDVDKLAYITGIPLFHNDYKLLYPNKKEQHSAGYKNACTESNQDGLNENRFNTENVFERAELGPKTYQALEDIADLCNKNNIKLIFLVTPYQAKKEDMAYINSVKDYANDNDIRFIDMNTYSDEIGIDLTTDMYDWGHALVEGEIKNSIWLSEYLSNSCNVPDRRYDENYSYWDLVLEEREKWLSQVSGQPK